ncbi:MAG: TonB-dependent receptor [Niabella sp.]|nr:TonB-dependent receptor [Niabella sp.]
MSHAQSKKISGAVTDANNAPVAGASVQEKGTSNGVITDNDGKFVISVTNSKAVLVVSGVGFTASEVAAARVTAAPIKLVSSQQALDEVVVVGYGTQKKTSVTGSVSVISSKAIANRPVTNAINALQGTAPGLIISRTSGQPGKEGWNINIRGMASLSGSNSPLIIIDGAQGDLNTINPDDIASVSVLEDAAATAIYGAKGGAGVVLVTTKTGAGSKKPRITISNIYSIRTPYARPEMISSGEQARLQNVALQNNGQSLAYNDQQLRWFDDPDTNYVWNAATKGYDYYYNYNLADMLMRKSSPQNNTNISVSGSNGRSSYLASFGYNTQDGVFKFGPDNYKRYNARLNYITQISDKISFDSRIAYTYEKAAAPAYGVGGDGSLMYEIYQIRSARNPIWTPGSDSTKYMYLGTLSRALPTLKDGGYDNTYKHTINGVFTLTAKELAKGLQLRAVYSPTLIINSEDFFQKPVPRYTIDSSLNSILTPTSQWLNYPGYLNKGREISIRQSVQGLVDYDWRIKDDHHFHVLGGFEYQMFNYNYVKAIQKGLLVNSFPTLNYTTLSTADIGNVGDIIQAYAYASEFGRLDYDYKNKYFLQANIRNDGTSRVAPDRRFQDFPGLSVGWRVSQEDWMKNISWLNELKVRASYGSNGLVQNDKDTAHNYDYQAVLNTGAYPFNDSRTGYVYQGANASITKAWEKISQQDVGLDLVALNRRLNFSFDYYIRNNKNIYVQQQLPSELGLIPSSKNIGAFRVNGWQFSLGWNDVFKNGSYFVSVNLNDNKTMVTRYDGALSVTAGINQNLPGYPVNSIFGYRTAGYFNTQADVDASAKINSLVHPGDIKYVDVNGDGKINQGTNTLQDHGDLVYLGNTNPRYTYGVNLGATWKGFDISALIQGVGKKDMLLSPTLAMPYYNGWQLPWKIHEDYWTPTHTDALYPAFRLGDQTINSQISSFFVQKANYIRLKNLQVGYTFNKKQLGSGAFESIRVFFTGQDIWDKTGMWFNYFDPENTDKLTFQYPLWRSYAFGINVTF